MNNPLEAYYVMRLNKYGFVPPPFQHLFTVCQAFNDNLLGPWAFLYGELLGHPGWVHYYGTNLKADDAALKAHLQLPDLNLMEIRDWVTDQYQAGKLGWQKTFPDLKLAQEYHRRFFGNLPNTYILAIFYLEERVEEQWPDLKVNLPEFGPAKPTQARKATLTKPQETWIGYDIIRHSSCKSDNLILNSFLLQNLGKDLAERFGVELNEYGLLKNTSKKEAITAYLNNPESEAESQLWSWVQVKLFAP